MVYRYNEDGTIDNTYGMFEKTLRPETLAFPQGTDHPFYNPNFSVDTRNFFYSELITDENLNKTIVTLSNFSIYSSSDNSIFRINSDGNTEDVSFSNGQLDMIKNWSKASNRLPFLIQNNGNYLISSLNGSQSQYSNLSFSLTNQGAINNSFGVNSIVNVDLGNVNSEVGDIAKQSNGKLLFAGDIDSRQSGLVNEVIKDKLFCFRLNANGELDNTFGESGSITFELNEETSYKNIKILVDENDKIYIFVACGFTPNNTGGILNKCKVFKLNITN